MYAEEMWMHVSLGSRAPPIPPPHSPAFLTALSSSFYSLWGLWQLI